MSVQITAGEASPRIKRASADPLKTAQVGVRVLDGNPRHLPRDRCPLVRRSPRRTDPPPADDICHQ